MLAFSKYSALQVDGGLSNQLPTDNPAQMGAYIFIGVDVTTPDLASRNLLCNRYWTVIRRKQIAAKASINSRKTTGCSFTRGTPGLSAGVCYVLRPR